jgi:hypothetical protein
MDEIRGTARMSNQIGGGVMENEALSDVRDTYGRYAQDWMNVKM